MREKFFTFFALLFALLALVFIHYLHKKPPFCLQEISSLAKMPLFSYESSIYEQNRFIKQSTLPKINPIDPTLPPINKMDFVYER